MAVVDEDTFLCKLPTMTPSLANRTDDGSALIFHFTFSLSSIAFVFLPAIPHKTLIFPGKIDLKFF